METDLPDGGEVLAHHGVKGMRWGVIRKKASAGRAATAKALRKAGRGTVKTVSGTVSATKRGVKTVQKAHERHQERTIARTQRKAEIKARKKFAKKGYRKISDTELQSRIKRLEQEKRYRELKADRHLVRGREVTRQILEGSLTKAGTYAGNKLMRSAFDSAFEQATGQKSDKEGGLADKVKKAAEKAKEGAEEAMAAANEVSTQSRSEAKALIDNARTKKVKTPKQIEKPKSYKQTKPSPKKKRRPRNPGSPLK